MAERFFDKFGFQRVLQNQAFMRSPFEVKGVFFELRTLAGNSEHADGSIPVGNMKRAKVDDLLDYLTDFGDQKGKNHFKKILDRLIRVGALTQSPQKVIKIAGYEEEQNLGRTVETNRKRAAAQNDLLELVNRAGTSLRGVFKRSKAQQLPYDMLIQQLRSEFNIYTPRAAEIIKRMLASGVLVSFEDGLYSLASLVPPPESGSGLGASGLGSGADHSGSRNIPLESELESDSELEGTNVPSAGSAGTRPRSSGEAHGNGASGSGGGGTSEASASSRSSEPTDSMLSPEDAWHVRDPLQAVEAFLCNKQGWCDKPDGDYPPSKFALRGKWRDLRKAVGVAEAERMWRQALFDIFMDHCDGQSWRSWIAGFQSKLKIAQEVAESMRSVSDD